MRINSLIGALALLPLLLTSCNSSGPEDTGTNATPNPTNNGTMSTLSCKSEDVLRTGISKGGILDVRVSDGSFYVAGEKNVSRVPMGGGASEVLITFKDEARVAALTTRGVVTIPFTGTVRYTDYAGTPIGEWAFTYTTTTAIYDAANNQLLLVKVADKIMYDAIDLETQTRRTHEVVDPTGGWASLFAGTRSDDWIARAGNGAIYLEHEFDDGKISRIALNTNEITRFVPELPEAQIKGFADGATYVWTGSNRKTEVIELYRVEASGATQTVNELHNMRNLTIAIVDGFDGKIYYRLNDGIYLVTGTNVERIGTVESECQRDGFLSVAGQYYAVSHPTSTGTATEKVIMKLKI